MAVRFTGAHFSKDIIYRAVDQHGQPWTCCSRRTGIKRWHGRCSRKRSVATVCPRRFTIDGSETKAAAIKSYNDAHTGSPLSSGRCGARSSSSKAGNSTNVGVQIV